MAKTPYRIYFVASTIGRYYEQSVVRCSFSVVWYSMAWYRTVWCCVVWYITGLYGMIWYYGMVWHGMAKAVL